MQGGKPGEPMVIVRTTESYATPTFLLNKSINLGSLSQFEIAFLLSATKSILTEPQRKA